MDENTNREILLTILRVEPLKDVTPEQWCAVAHLAQQHRLVEFLYSQLKKQGLAPRVPAELLQSLRADYLRTAKRNLRIYQELRGLFAGFQRAGIDGILLKGAYLAEEVYGDVGVRPMGDADVLVKKQDLERVAKVMQDLGYARTNQLDEMIAEDYHFAWMHTGHGLMVEIHWDLIDSLAGIHVNMDALWERVRPARIAGTWMHGLSAEDQLLHLCIHTTKHIFDIGLRAMCDLTETVRRFHDSMDWDCLRRRTDQWNAARAVYVNLRLAKELLHAPVPDDWLNDVKPKDFEPHYLVLAREHLFASAEKTIEAYPESPYIAEYWMRHNTAGRFGLIVQRLVPSRRIMAIKYPVSPDSPRIFLYYPVRVWDLLRRYGRTAWQLYRGDKQMQSRAERQDRINALRNWLLSG